MTLVSRRWFQFTLRSVLLFMLVSVLVCSYLATRMYHARQQRKAVEWIERESAPTAHYSPPGSVLYDYQFDPTSTKCISEQGRSRHPSEPQWLRNLFCDDFFHDIVAADVSRDDQMEKLAAFPYLRKLALNEQGMGYTTVTDSGLRNLAKLRYIETLDLSFLSITDTQLSYLKSLTALRDLGLRNSQLTDDAPIEELTRLTALQTLDLSDVSLTGQGLEKLACLTALRDLNLADNPVTDSGLAHIASLVKLESLNLSGNIISDGGLRILSGMVQLRKLNLVLTSVTDAGLEFLKHLHQLEELHLDSTGITDAGILRLSALTNLKHLSIHDTKVTADGEARLRKALPGCSISRKESD